MSSESTADFALLDVGLLGIPSVYLISTSHHPVRQYSSRLTSHCVVLESVHPSVLRREPLLNIFALADSAFVICQQSFLFHFKQHIFVCSIHIILCSLLQRHNRIYTIAYSCAV